MLIQTISDEACKYITALVSSIQSIGTTFLKGIHVKNSEKARSSNSGTVCGMFTRHPPPHVAMNI
jgi:hypothetical protein